MAQQIVLNGTLSVGPLQAGSGVIPSGTLGFDLATSPDPKPSPAQDKGARLVASPSAYVAIGSVGANQNVVQGDALYLKTDSPMLFRLSTDDGVGGTVVSVVPVSGTLLVEFDQTKFLKLLEVQGAGTVEYFISGQGS